MRMDGFESACQVFLEATDENGKTGLTMIAVVLQNSFGEKNLNAITK